MLNKILFCKSLFQSKQLKVYSHQFSKEGTLNSTLSIVDEEGQNASQIFEETSGGVITIRSTDKQAHELLSRLKGARNHVMPDKSQGNKTHVQKYLSFNKHLPWFYTDYLNIPAKSTDYILYFDESNTDVIQCEYPQNHNQNKKLYPSNTLPSQYGLTQIGGAIDYGFFLGYSKISLYLELERDSKMIAEDLKQPEFVNQLKMTQISAFSEIVSVEQLGPMEGDTQNKHDQVHSSPLCFSIEQFLVDQRSKIFKSSPVKTHKNTLNQGITLKSKKEVAYSFEIHIYRQIRQAIKVLKEQHARKFPNKQCQILLCGSITYNMHFRQMISQICESLGVKLILHSLTYQNIVPHYIRGNFSENDETEDLMKLPMFLNVGYAPYKPY